MNPDHIIKRRIRPLLILFMAGLVLSGVTAFPLETEVRILSDMIGVDSPDSGIWPTALKEWIGFVREGLITINRTYPFMSYGTDWLAFAHLVIAIVFIGPYKDPVRNKWVILFGMIACAGVIPLALIAGAIREIPFWWRLIDCSFGVFGIIPLMYIWRCIGQIEHESH